MPSQSTNTEYSFNQKKIKQTEKSSRRSKSVDFDVLDKVGLSQLTKIKVDLLLRNPVGHEK